MRRLVIMPWRVYHNHIDYFDPLGGSHFLCLSGDEVPWEDQDLIVSVDFASEASEEFVLDHPEVIELPDPIVEGTTTMKQHHENKETKFQKHHFDQLSKRFPEIQENHTVLEVSKICSNHNPLLKVGKINRRSK